MIVDWEMGMKMVKTLSLAICACAMVARAQVIGTEPQQLMEADRAFDRAVSVGGAPAWASYFAPNGSMLGDTLPPILGREAIQKAMARSFADSTFSLRWWPTRAEMLIPGVIGYTVGRYNRYKADSTGTLHHETGTYATVWKKQPDGSWKIVLDTGEEDKN